MIARYEIFKQEKYVEHCGIVKTYGIVGIEDETCIIEDISDEYDEILDLVNQLNNLQVELVHFSFVVNDFITTKYL